MNAPTDKSLGIGLEVDSHLWAYLAGLIDGDGCFHTSFNNHSQSVKLVISMLHEPTIDRIYSIFGGRKQQDPDRGPFRRAFRWEVNATWMRNNLHCLIPWLVTKLEQAVIVQQILNLRSAGVHPQEQEHLVSRMKELNRRGAVV